MVADMRKTISELRANNNSYKEINRILLQENLDLKDFLEESNIDICMNLRDLRELYSVFSDEYSEDDGGDENEIIDVVEV